MVEEVAIGVNRFAVGDEVFGVPWSPREAGCYAEYVTALTRSGDAAIDEAAVARGVRLARFLVEPIR